MSRSAAQCSALRLPVVLLLASLRCRRCAQEPIAPAGPTLAGGARARPSHLRHHDPLPGFAQPDADGRWIGFDVDFCRAVAAAVFGDPEQDGVPCRCRGDSRFAQLQTGDDRPHRPQRALDHAARHRLRRQLRRARSFFDGQAFMVPQSLGVVSAYRARQCHASASSTAARSCERCGSSSSPTRRPITEVLYEDREDLAVAYQPGLCNAVSAPASWLNAIRRGLPEPATHRILPERISKAAFGPVVRAGDDQWFDIVALDAVRADQCRGSRRHLAQHRLARGRQDPPHPPPARARGQLRPGDRARARLHGQRHPRRRQLRRDLRPPFRRRQTGAAVVRGQNALWINGGLLYAPPIE